LLRLRPWHRLAAFCVASRLDRQLAAGLSSETNARLAVRAAQLTSMEFRRDLVELARCLIAPGPVRVQGVAMVS
jgi:hypothetical protein